SRPTAMLEPRVVAVALAVGLGGLGGPMSGESQAAEEAFGRLHSLHLSFQIGKEQLPDDRALTEADVRRAVSPAHAPLLDELIGEPQFLNDRLVNPDEVLLFLKGLARQPEAQLLQMRLTAIDLGSPGLRLHYQDGFGVHGLARPWQIEGLLSSRK